MAWYDPRDWDWEKIGDKAGDVVTFGHLGDKIAKGIDRRNNVSPGLQGVDAEGNLRGQSGAAAAFGDQGQLGYGKRTSAMEGLAGQLGRLARGEDSYSAEQLRQSLGQTLAAQQSMAAGARPGNAAMAARNAAANMSRQQSGLAGQQALAGIAERNAAAQSLGNMLGQMRGQDLQAALGSRGQAIQGYGTYEGNRTSRYGAELGVPTGTEQVMSGVGSVLGTLAGLSDEQAKTAKRRGGGRSFLAALGTGRDIVEGQTGGKPSGRAFLDALRDYRYQYRNPGAPGAAPGRQLGVMAQDLERSRLGRRAVVPTPAGRMVDTTRLAHALAAGAADLNQRVKRLEGKRG